jgi:hypothetical protein
VEVKPHVSAAKRQENAKPGLESGEVSIEAGRKGRTANASRALAAAGHTPPTDNRCNTKASPTTTTKKKAAHHAPQPRKPANVLTQQAAAKCGSVLQQNNALT